MRRKFNLKTIKFLIVSAQLILIPTWQTASGILAF